MTSVTDIRRTYLDYFAKNGHSVVQSAPLVPDNDPTLMFVNAGMVPFKNVFTGMESRDYTRATSSQKCVRAGGKHNDLDNVGYTARHLTFFEMLGNFSFGDYFKEEAIALAWGLLTDEFDMPTDRLLVTVYHEDEEAAALWKKIAGFSDDKIIRIKTSDNFWSMGDTGPCGPCSEIFFDHGPSVPGGPPGSPDEDGDRYIEFWNNVFMQYEQIDAETRIDLPKPSIDTGMGLERITATLNGTHDLFQTDLVRGLIEASADFTSVDPDGPQAASHKVIADHLRSSAFLVADGVLPSKDGRGYVLRRIMRRAMRHAHILGADEPLMHKLVPHLVREMGGAYPELVRAEALISETLKGEETRFRKTLDRGLKLLDDETGDLDDGDQLSGDIAFKLYDTYGFPLDLTQDALRPRGIAVDTDGFDAAMEKQRADARKAWAGSGGEATDAIWFDLKEAHGASEFLGYEKTRADGEIIAMVKEGALVEKAVAGDQLFLLTNQTPFYGESGGQVGDTGGLIGPDGKGYVTDTQKQFGDLIIHCVTVAEGELTVGDAVDLHVDEAARDKTRSNHSATHLLHAALRNVLGDHVAQKGSQVGPDRLRFDFAHPRAMTAEEINAAEAEVNAIIRQNRDAETRLMTPDEAIAEGAMALFGEKYGDEVRVLTMGDTGDGKAYSVELCGGTHVRRMGDIGLMRIVSESAVAAGVRRVEALTGEAALQHLDARDQITGRLAGLLKTGPDDIEGRVVSLMDERKKLEAELAEAKKQLALGGGAGNAQSGDEVEDIAGLKLIARSFDGLNPKDLRGMVDDAKGKLGSGIVVFVTNNDGKAALAAGVTDDLTDKVSAVDLVKAGAAACGGKGGGGRPDMAQAGGPDGSKAQDAIDAVKALLSDLG